MSTTVSVWRQQICNKEKKKASRLDLYSWISLVCDSGFDGGGMPTGNTFYPLDVWEDAARAAFPFASPFPSLGNV